MNELNYACSAKNASTASLSGREGCAPKYCTEIAAAALAYFAAARISPDSANF
ncbi:MAG: hypothetical protein MR380_11860 [Lachnospiraceae bacterium]|nr:hypothetical protein [Lachnospiraceae bacterium]